MGHTKKKEANNIDTSRQINLFSNAENSNSLQLGLPLSIKFALKCSVIQQRYGSSSRSTCSLDFKLTGIQIATKPMPGTTNREHRKLIGVKKMSLFGYGIRSLLSGVLAVFQNVNYNLQRRLSDVMPNQQSYQKFIQ